MVNAKNEILLVKRSINSGEDPGTWSRPGGKVEFGERIEAAVEREVEEEVGIKVRAMRLLNVTQYIENGKHWISFGYLVEHLVGTPVNKEPDKHDAVGWFALGGLPEDVNEYTLNAIRAYKESLAKRD